MEFTVIRFGVDRDFETMGKDENEKAGATEEDDGGGYWIFPKEITSGFGFVGLEIKVRGILEGLDGTNLTDFLFWVDGEIGVGRWTVDNASGALGVTDATV
jgi:hypothetical protein